MSKERPPLIEELIDVPPDAQTEQARVTGGYEQSSESQELLERIRRLEQALADERKARVQLAKDFNTLQSAAQKVDALRKQTEENFKTVVDLLRVEREKVKTLEQDLNLARTEINNLRDTSTASGRKSQVANVGNELPEEEHEPSSGSEPLPQQSASAEPSLASATKMPQVASGDAEDFRERMHSFDPTIADAQKLSGVVTAMFEFGGPFSNFTELTHRLSKLGAVKENPVIKKQFEWVYFDDRFGDRTDKNEAENLALSLVYAESNNNTAEQKGHLWEYVKKLGTDCRKALKGAEEIEKSGSREPLLTQVKEFRKGMDKFKSILSDRIGVIVREEGDNLVYEISESARASMMNQQTEPEKKKGGQQEFSKEEPKEFNIDKGIDIEKGKSELLKIFEDAKRDLVANAEIRQTLESFIKGIKTEKPESQRSRTENLVMLLVPRLYNLKICFRGIGNSEPMHFTQEEQDRIDRVWEEFKTIAKSIFYLFIDDLVGEPFDAGRHFGLQAGNKRVKSVYEPGIAILLNHPTIKKSRGYTRFTRAHFE